MATGRCGGKLRLLVAGATPDSNSACFHGVAGRYWLGGFGILTLPGSVYSFCVASPVFGRSEFPLRIGSCGL
jgi:hypothetical protein